MSKEARFTYSGPVSGATLNVQGGRREIMFHPGRTYELPADHPYVQRLVARGFLAKVSAPKTRASAPKTSSKEES
jgi:hypothetical protein